MNSRFPQLRSYLNELTLQFTKNVCDACSEYHFSLAFSQNQLKDKILKTLKIQKTINPLEEYGIKLSLENSLDDVVKKQHKEQELYLHDEFDHNSSRNSDNFGIIFECEQIQNQHVKKQVVSEGEQNQITVYHEEKVDNSGDKKITDNNLESKFFTCPKQQLYESDSDSGRSEIMDEQNSREYQNSDFFDTLLLHQKGIMTDNATVPTFVNQRKYRFYSQKSKKQAVNKALEFSVEYSSRLYNIPKKNIARWMKKKKTQVRGRKPTNTDMEEKLSLWIEENIEKDICLTQYQIRKKAKEYSNNENFRASKGWLEKYYRRNKPIAIRLCNLRELKRKPNQSHQKTQPTHIKNLGSDLKEQPKNAQA